MTSLTRHRPPDGKIWDLLSENQRYSQSEGWPYGVFIKSWPVGVVVRVHPYGLLQRWTGTTWVSIKEEDIDLPDDWTTFND